MRSIELSNGDWHEIHRRVSKWSLLPVWLKALIYTLLGLVGAIGLFLGFVLGCVRSGVRLGERAFDGLVIIVTWLVICIGCAFALMSWTSLLSAHWNLNGAAGNTRPSATPPAGLTDVRLLQRGV